MVVIHFMELLYANGQSHSVQVSKRLLEVEKLIELNANNQIIGIRFYDNFVRIIDDIEFNTSPPLNYSGTTYIGEVFTKERMKEKHFTIWEAMVSNGFETMVKTKGGFFPLFVGDTVINLNND